jgi:predicted Zn-dependent peptidase
MVLYSVWYQLGRSDVVVIGSYDNERMAELALQELRSEVDLRGEPLYSDSGISENRLIQHNI